MAVFGLPRQAFSVRWQVDSPEAAPQGFRRVQGTSSAARVPLPE
jgi:hypothetical protein